MTTLRDYRRAAEARLRAAGVETPELDARLLIQHALGLERTELLLRADQPLEAERVARADALIDRRAGREPVARILGRREFWSLDFRLCPATLEPRPDTETVVEAALAAIPDRSAPRTVLDLGTGTGCLLLALLSELPNATGTGLDISPEAVAAAAANAERLGFAGRARFAVADWNRGLSEPEVSGPELCGPYDLIVSNPPYIPDAEIPTLQPEVARHEPRAALAGGADGLDAYRALAPRLPNLLRRGGLVALEVGAGQAPVVAGLLESAGLAVRGTAHDLGGIERCVVAGADG